MVEEAIVITPSKPLRRRAVEAGLGTLAGIVFACVNGPGLLSLLYTPPSGDSLSCGPTVSNALDYFLKLQLTSGALGGVVVLVASFMMRRMLRRRREARAAPSP